MIFSRKSLKRRIGLWGKKTVIAFALALMAGVVYLAFSIHFADTQRSTIDEGLYLYKGYQFAIGKYIPYQDDGFRTLYTPLAYLIPGYAQLLFGPGLRTGRTLAILSGLLALIGFWLVVRRLRGDWWAAAAVWAAALNPGNIRPYSFGVVQGTVICLLIWALYFSLDRHHHVWQVPIGAVLSGLLLLTRQNMAPVLPILVLYIFWQYGRKLGWIAILVGLITILVGHLVFWPEIIKTWALWLPPQLTPFLNAWRIPPGATPYLNVRLGISAKIYGFLEGLRFHFISVTGFAISLIFWPKRSSFRTNSQFRTAAFLTSLFAVLFVLHAWAGLGFSEGNGYNSFTFNTYLAFFDYLGIMIFVLIFPALEKGTSLVRQIAAVLTVLTFAVGIGFGGFNIFGDTLINLKIPRIKTFFTTGHILPGKVPLWDFLLTQYGIPHNSARLLVPEFTGLIVGLIFLMVGGWFWNKFRRMKYPFYSYGLIVILFFFFVGLVLTPTPLLGGGFNQWNCTGNVITDYEMVGHDLAERIPEGSQVYWDGGNAVAILLYIPNIRIFPQQIDGMWNFFHGGDSSTIARLGSWNDELAKRWRDEAKVIIIQHGNYPDWQSYLDTPGFIELTPPKVPLNCEPDTYLRLFIRNTSAVADHRWAQPPGSVP